MANLIPMAGLGSRFSKEGWPLPKPLIPVSGEPMVVQAIRSMPPSDNWIFVVRKEHVDQFQLDNVIKKEVSHARIIAIDYTTEGQACTCLLAEPYLRPDEPLFIAACDIACLYDAQRYQELCNRKDVDAVVWTFTKHGILRERPTSFGWVVAGKDAIITDVKVKVPVSDKPYDDHAIVASFFFKKAGDFVKAAKLMIEENYRINNEFYVDAVPLFLKKLGKRSAMFDVIRFLCWGSPADLNAYQQLEQHCKNRQYDLLSPEEQAALPALKAHFKHSAP
jgi:dTDP-glucose pyrophosphorylase